MKINKKKKIIKKVLASTLALSILISGNLYTLADEANTNKNVLNEESSIELNEEENILATASELGSAFFVATNNADVKALIPINADGSISLSNVGNTADRVLVISNTADMSIEENSGNFSYIPKNTNISIVNEVLEEFRNVNYIDIVRTLNPRIRYLDKLDIRNKLRAELGREPSEQEVDNKALEAEGEKLNWKDSFNEVKNNIDTLLKGIVERSGNLTADNLRLNKNKLLIALTYLQRQYNFKFGDVLAKDLILYHAELFGATNSAFDRALLLGNMNYTNAQLINSAKTYSATVANITAITDILDFISYNLNIFEAGTNAKDWFIHNSKAYIYETRRNDEHTSSLYEKMAWDERLKSNLIGLLTLSSDSIYAISTSSTVTYGLVDTYVSTNRESAEITSFIENLRLIGEQQQAYLDFLYRVSETKDRIYEGNDIIHIDSLRRYGTAPARDLWVDEYGANSNDGVREFIGPYTYYRKFAFLGGEAGGDRANYWLEKLLTHQGIAVYTHEMTHILEDRVVLNGYSRRTGEGAEFYARGLFESIDNSRTDYAPVFNINTAYELNDTTRTQNFSPNRFESQEDVGEYARGLMDVLYTLDYAEAKVSLEKSPSDKAILFNELKLMPDPNRAGVVNDVFEHINEEKAARLNSIDDLIDNSMVSGRLEVFGKDTVGRVAYNGYYVIPLFDPMYAAPKNDAGFPGARSFKRNSYDILGEYGYKDGMIAYISSKYANDREALNNILSDYSGDILAFKKAMFRRRIEKVEKLKPTSVFNNFAELENLMEEAVNSDLATMKANKLNGNFIANNANAVRDLKTRIFREYLVSTNDFRSSIYKEDIISEETEIEEVEIEIDTIKQYDTDIYDGEVITIEGSKGLKRIKKVYRTENGIRVGEPTITEEVIKEMRPTIIKTGVKPIFEKEILEERIRIPYTYVEGDPLLDKYEDEVITLGGHDGIDVIETTIIKERGREIKRSTRRYGLLVMEPHVTRRGIKPVYSERVEEETVEIPIKESVIESESLYVGEEEVEAGQAGSKKIVKRIKLKKGVETGEVETEEEILVPMKEKVIKRGTKPVYSERVEEETVEIPIRESVIESESLYVGEEEVEAGQVGSKKIVKRIKLKKGVETGEVETEEKVLVPMREKLIKRGTKPVYTEKVEETLEIIPVIELAKEDKNLYIGEQRIEEGSSGLKKIIKTIKLYKGMETDEIFVKEELIKNMQPRIVYRGIKTKINTDIGINKNEIEKEISNNTNKESSVSGTSGGSGLSSSKLGGFSNIKSSGYSLFNLSRWVFMNNRWRWMKYDGNYAKSSWLYIKNEWYHFDSAAYMNIGWFIDEKGDWYHAIEAGNKAGQLTYGWYYDRDKHWYYLDTNGKMITGTKVINGKFYKFSEISTKKQPLGSLIEK